MTVLAAVSALLNFSNATAAFDRAAAFNSLKAEMHTLTPQDATRRLKELRTQMGGTPTPPRQDKIDHVVVLLMENHAADNMIGCMVRAKHCACE